MVAGLISSLYQQPTGSVTPPPKPKFVLSDNLMDTLGAATPAVTCAQLVGCPATKTKAKQIAYKVKYDAFRPANAPPAG